MDFNTLQAQTGMPVLLCRDLDSALANELLANSKLKEELVVLLHWGIGLGISFAYRGQILQSNHGRFGTIGYTQFNPYAVDHIGENNMEQHTSLRGLFVPFAINIQQQSLTSAKSRKSLQRIALKIFPMSNSD